MVPGVQTDQAEIHNEETYSRLFQIKDYLELQFRPEVE